MALNLYLSQLTHIEGRNLLHLLSPFTLLITLAPFSSQLKVTPNKCRYTSSIDLLFFYMSTLLKKNACREIFSSRLHYFSWLVPFRRKPAIKLLPILNASIFLASK